MKKHINKISAEAVKKAYQFYAPIYDYVFGAILEPGRRALTNEVKSINPTSLLEIGVGTGLLLEHYPLNCKITGIDISEEMLNIAKHKSAKLTHDSITLQMMNAEQLTYEDESFECVVLPYVLSVTPNPDLLIAETRRVCKKNGVIIIVNHFSGSGFWWILERVVKNIAKKIGFRSEFSYEENILKYDWTITKVDSTNLFSLSKIIVIRNDSNNR